jgi:hypothetical protein
MWVSVAVRNLILIIANRFFIIFIVVKITSNIMATNNVMVIIVIIFCFRIASASKNCCVCGIVVVMSCGRRSMSSKSPGLHVATSTPPGAFNGRKVCGELRCGVALWLWLSLLRVALLLCCLLHVCQSVCS